MQELIGRKNELNLIRACLGTGRHVLIEGPVGSGKTTLANAIAKELGQPLIRVDGDGRYSESKLAGAFDPAITMNKGYIKEAFRDGPLTQAMKTGAILLLNEINRLPEGTQNLLLPAMDEGVLILPRLGEIRAHASFRVIATQNPKEYVATSPLSEALLDRFERLSMDYPEETEEAQILASHLGKDLELAGLLTKIARLSRDHSRIRRGASLRAAISTGILTQNLRKSDSTLSVETALRLALPLGFSGRMELEGDSSGMQGILEGLLQDALQKRRSDPGKKKP